MTTKYRKKPVMIEAVQWSGSNVDELGAFSQWTVGESWVSKGVLYFYDAHWRRINAHPGDWIVKGLAGEFYVVEDQMFSQIYEVVEGEK